MSQSLINFKKLKSEGLQLSNFILFLFECDMVSSQKSAIFEESFETLQVDEGNAETTQ